MTGFSKLFDDVGRLWSVYGEAYLRGVMNTLILAVVATVAGCVIGRVCGVLNTIPSTKNDSVFKRVILKAIRVIVRIYVEVFRGTPMVLQAVLIFYGCGFTYSVADIWTAAIIVVSINTGAYMAESVRGGIISIDPGQTEGAKAIGMTHVQTMRRVIMPQVLRNIIPQIGNNLIINIKDTSVMFVIGFVDFFATHRNIVGLNSKYFPSAVIEMVGYLTLTLLFSFLLRFVERKLDGNANYELVQDDSLTMTAGTYSHPKRGSNYDEQSKEYAGKLKKGGK